MKLGGLTKSSLGPFGAPWPSLGRLGLPWASPLGLPLKIMKNWRSFTGKRARSVALVHKIEPPGILNRIPRIPRKWVPDCASEPLSTRAGG